MWWGGTQSTNALKERAKNGSAVGPCARLRSCEATNHERPAANVPPLVYRASPGVVNICLAIRCLVFCCLVLTFGLVLTVLKCLLLCTRSFG